MLEFERVEVSEIFKCDNYDNEIKKEKVKEIPRKNLITITPRELKFTFQRRNWKTLQKIVQITNYSSKPCPLSISPPKTSYFKITSKTLKKWLNPGSSFLLKISFAPDEIRNYHDMVEIQEFDKRSSILKISAIPLCEINFPKNVNFGNVPLGSIACFKIPIHSDVEEKISFAVFLLSEIEYCLNVHPLYGSLKPGQNSVFINVEYQALRYITATFQIQLFIPEVCKSPFLINFTAYTRPGLQGEKFEKLIEPIKNYEELKKKKPPKQSNKLNNRIFFPKLKSLYQKKEKKNMKETEEEHLFKKLGKIPPYSLHGVNIIMNACSKKTHNNFALRGPLNMFTSETLSQKLKYQNQFLEKAENIWKQNEIAKINHKPKLGEIFTDSYAEKMYLILAERKQYSCEYKNRMLITPDNELLQRRHIVKIRQRTLRLSTENFEEITLYQLNCNWLLRYDIIAHFIQAARVVILKNRLKRVLNILKKLTPEIIERIEKLVTKKEKKLECHEWKEIK